MTWTLPILRIGHTEKIQFKATSTEPGFQKLSVQTVYGAMQNTAQLSTNVVGLQNLRVSLRSSKDDSLSPLQSSVTVGVENISGKPLKAVDLQVELPEGMTAVPSAAFEIVENTLVFNVFDLNPDTGHMIRFAVSSSAQGEVNIQAVAKTSDDPVTMLETNPSTASARLAMVIGDQPVADRTAGNQFNVK